MWEKSMISKIKYILSNESRRDFRKAKLQALDFKELILDLLEPFEVPIIVQLNHQFLVEEVLCKMGEIALVIMGFFFDELPHFSKSILEALREPFEDNKILFQG